MKLRKNISKCYISSIFLILTGLLNHIVSGDILDPPLTKLAENDEELISVNRNTLTVVETKVPQVGTNIRLARIRHNGGANNVISLGGNYPTSVRVERDGELAYLTLDEPLDFENVKQHIFSVTQNPGNPKGVILNVKNINDNPPVFENPCQVGELLEDADSNTVVCTFHATDRDEMDRDALRYFFEESLPWGKNLFSINTESGEFSLIGGLDYIENPMYRFEVIVEDSDKVHRVPTIFTLRVKDVPNLAPVWTKFQPTVEVEDGSTNGHEIQTMKAKDGDIQVKSDLEYTIRFDHMELGRYFDLNDVTGVLSVKEKIDATDISDINGGIVINAVVTVTERNDRNLWPDPDKYPDLILESDLQIIIRSPNFNTYSPEFCVNDLDCDSENEISIVTDENVFGILPLTSGTIFVRDLDPMAVFSTFDVVLEEISPDQKYIVDSLLITPTFGVSRAFFSISTRNSLDYEDRRGFDGNDEGKWWKRNDAGVPEPKPVKFIIKATDRENTSRVALKEVTLTVRDKNDNPPVHKFPKGQAKYSFGVCEDVSNNTVLKRKAFDASNPVCPEQDGEEVHFDAIDADISDIFGTPSIEYLWFSKHPPLELDKISGKMTVKWPEGSNGVFDFERYQEETFTVEAIDEIDTPEYGSRKRSTAIVTFVILDVNDTPVALRLSASRIEIEENTTNVAFPVIIEAIDEDLQGCVEFELRVDSTTGNDELDEQIARWFKIVSIDGEETTPCKRERSARIELGDLAVDREGYGTGLEVDRVDVSVIAKDINTKTGDLQRSVRLTIEIKDTNDNPPEFQDYDESDEIRFIESFGVDFGEDAASLNERELKAFRVTDRDKNSQFSFSLSSPYPLMEELVELDSNPNGRAILRRNQGVIIDRENENFYGAGDTDTLHYIITVSDSVNENQINVYIKIDDLNDNSPNFENLEKEFSVTEGTAKPLIETFKANDPDRPDRYGNVSYFLLPGTENDPEPGPTFSIGIQSGIFNVDASTKWHEISEYKIKVEAVDYYRPSSSSSSNRVNYDITVTVIDINDHDPRFITSQNYIWNEIKETEFDAGSRFENPIEIEDLDDISLGNGDFSVRITAVECVPQREGVDPGSFFDPVLVLENTSVKPSRKNLWLKASKSFENHWGEYTVHFEAEDNSTSEAHRKSTGSYKINVKSENLHYPKFGYPNGNNTKLFISYVAPSGPISDYYGVRLPQITVTDEDDPRTGHGQISTVVLDDTSRLYFMLEPRLIPIPGDGSSYNSNLLKTEVAFPETNWLHTIVITATDGGTPPNSVEVHLTIQVVPDFNSPPIFKDEDKPFDREIMENDPDWEVDSPVAEDLDLIVGIVPDVIYYHLAGGAVDYFNFDTRIVNGVNVSRLSLKSPLDYEEIDNHKLVILASNNPTPPETPVDPENVDPNDKSYLIVGITVLDQDEDNENVHSPKFCLSESDCVSPFEYSIMTDENVVGHLPLEIGSIFVKDLDTKQQYSTFDVILEAESPEQKYVIDALSISPKYGIFETSFYISAISSHALDYEDKREFEGNDNEGRWWRKNDADVPEPKPVKFFIRATDRNDPSKSDRKEVILTVRDKNDNAPFHKLQLPVKQAEYIFAVCENVSHNTVLKRKTYNASNPVCTEEDGEEVRFEALDADVSFIFGTPSIEYLWFSKPPPLQLDKDTGKMTVKWPEGSNGVFNFERYQEETFVVEAIDEKLTPESDTRQRSTATVTFVILDVNDTPVDLIMNTSRISIQENTKGVVFEVNIKAKDEDLSGCVEFDLNVDSTTGDNDLDAKIARWFKIVPIDAEETIPCKRERSARIELGDLAVDREGYESGLEVDRVDVSVIARDTNTQHGVSEKSIRLTIEILDKNDNAPEFQDYDENEEIRITESFGLDFEGGDSASPTERDIMAFTASDPDRNSQLTFSMRSPYPLMEELVELSYANGRAILRRKLGVIIDRENENFYGAGDTDTLHYIIRVSDSVNENHINVNIKIDDLNDNLPVFENTVREFFITEQTAKPLIEIFKANDADRPDRYGNVSYFAFSSTGSDPEPFSIDIQTGVLSVDASTVWHVNSQYQLKIEAVDYYRPSSIISSNRVPYLINVNVVDVNDHTPQFLTNQNIIWNTIKETDVIPGQRFENPIVIEDLDDFYSGNGNFNVQITGAKCDISRDGVDPLSFFNEKLVLETISIKPNRQNVWLAPAKSFAHHWGNYTVHFEAKDTPAEGEARISIGAYKISIGKDYFLSGSARNFQFVGITQSMLLFILIVNQSIN